MKVMLILRNRAKCKVCHQTIESKHPTDWQTCQCGEIYVDGGGDTLKRGAINWDNFIELAETGDAEETNAA